jgi:antitoxin CptB|tara:strand:- start:7 stop:264 length:258 start_codon:yes stop_codon:yes gene_type:complete
MTFNKEELKNKIIYRSQYRGSKELDLLMSSFVKSIINDIGIDELLELNELVNLDDENLMDLRNSPVDQRNRTSNNIINKFVNFKY